ncbi:MAG: Asp-tRNA(Asn)/Glu-tRNA(Gln) amidotransferase subunit GatB [Clostridia bacterium]|nr:Asp-tRNA(Asn)/Glu-tRNA(Gln) amidotransferase subunit GatB [Clostridia bacterium]
MSSNYELVVGLETHVELLTNTKIFCSCINKFGDEPNTHCCPVCIGLPGTLPKLNSEVVRLAILAGLATNCKINLKSFMDRKNYVYPDLSKAYQISQYYTPICEHGYIELSNHKKIRINRIHMEEDAGKLVHKNGDVYIDYNRGGVPSIEIVTEPDISSSSEAREYVEKLQNILRYAGVSDCKMQEGSMRCDVNVSVKPVNSDILGTRTEIKNMNSVTFMTKAIDYEFERQTELLNNNQKIIQQTLRYIESTNSTESMRDKEDAQDYRYFRDPDLTEINLKPEYIQELQTQLPELPDSRINKYINSYEISEKDAALLVKYKRVSDFFESSIKNLKSPKIICNFIIGQIFMIIETESDREKFDILVTPDQINKLAALVETNKINMNLAKKTLINMLETGKDISEFISEQDMLGISEQDLEKFCVEAINSNQNAVQDYLNGKEKALKSILGCVMKQTRGRANAQVIENILVRLIKK